MRTGWRVPQSLRFAVMVEQNQTRWLVASLFKAMVQLLVGDITRAVENCTPKLLL